MKMVETCTYVVKWADSMFGKANDLCETAADVFRIALRVEGVKADLSKNWIRD